MVSSSRYLAHHENEAKRIDKILRQLGWSGGIQGFWCNKGNYTSFNDCIHCERDNYCHPNHPPLTRQYKIDSKVDRYLGDMMLGFIMHDKGIDDYIWLQHPETRKSKILVDSVHN